MHAIESYDERVLLQQIAEGDEHAFSQLYKRYFDKLYNYLMRITKSHQASEEIAVDVFLKLWTGRELIGNINDMNAFLLKVAKNKALDFFRLTARNERIQKIIEQSMDQRMAPGADHQILDKETQQILHDAIQQLSPQRRMVFSLSRIEGLSHDEIAEQLNLTKRTVKNTMVDALKSIKGYLKDKNVDGMTILWFLMHV